MGEIDNCVRIISSECAYPLVSQVPNAEGDIGAPPFPSLKITGRWRVTSLQGLQRLQETMGMSSCTFGWSGINTDDKSDDGAKRGQEEGFERLSL